MMKLTNPVYPPKEIVKRIREKISASDASCELVDKDDVDSSLHDGTGPPADNVDDLCDHSHYLQVVLSHHAMRNVYQAIYVSHNEKLGVFTVLGRTGSPNVIRLHIFKRIMQLPFNRKIILHNGCQDEHRIGYTYLVNRKLIELKSVTTADPKKTRLHEGRYQDLMIVTLLRPLTCCIPMN